jgi:preprotein translocase subunit SecE
VAKTRTQQQAPRRAGAQPSTGLYPREVISELRKVTWPTREEAVRLTGMVIVVSATVGLFLGAVDYIFSNLVTRFLIGL